MTDYAKGSAGLYFEWTRFQSPAAEITARQFRPWEWYALDGTDQLVRPQSYNDDGTVNAVVVEGTDVGAAIPSIDPERLELWRIPGLDDEATEDQPVPA